MAVGLGGPGGPGVCVGVGPVMVIGARAVEPGGCGELGGSELGGSDEAGGGDTNGGMPLLNSILINVTG